MAEHPLLQFAQVPHPQFKEWWEEFHRRVLGTQEEVYQRELWAFHGWQGKYDEQELTIGQIKHAIEEWKATGSGVQACDALECIAGLLGVRV